VRRKPAKFVKEDDCPFSLYSPKPDEYRRDEKDQYEHEQVIEFMQSGHILLEELKSKRLFKIQSEKSEDPYLDLIKEIYGSAEFEEGEDGCVVM
jgi:hypothetical protein